MIRHLLARVGSLYWLLALALLLPGSAPGQVSYEVTLEARGESYVGTAAVSATREVVVSARLWESREEPELELTRPAAGTVWPDTVRLEAGESQTVRVRVPRDAYEPGTVLRLETVLAPPGPAPSPDSATGVRARVRMRMRVLSKVHLGR